MYESRRGWQGRMGAVGRRWQVDSRPRDAALAPPGGRLDGQTVQEACQPAKGVCSEELLQNSVPCNSRCVLQAYRALTDEVARENYKKYGHPDGPQVRVGAPGFWRGLGSTLWEICGSCYGHSLICSVLRGARAIPSPFTWRLQPTRLVYHRCPSAAPRP